MFKEIVLLHVDPDLAEILRNRDTLLGELIREVVEAYPEDNHLRLAAAFSRLEATKAPDRLMHEWNNRGADIHKASELLCEIRRAAKKAAVWINMNC